MLQRRVGMLLEDGSETGRGEAMVRDGVHETEARGRGVTDMIATKM